MPSDTSIRDRTFRFAVRALNLAGGLPRDHAGRVVGRQLARRGAAIGANIEEARGVHSRGDFGRRMNIARTEAREALYWLRLASET